MTAALPVGGFTALSCSDYPGLLSAVVFCQGCPWRCNYCHNPHLLTGHCAHAIAWHDISAFLERRRGLLDAVVFSGGEPTLHAALPDAMREVKRMGFRTGLHTGGSYPRRLERVLPFADWVAMDVKAPFFDYDRITRARRSGAKALASLRALLASGVEYEIRTTVHPALIAPRSLRKLAQSLARLGVNNYVLQEFRVQGCTSPPLRNISSYLTEAYCSSIEPLFSTFLVRRTTPAAQHLV